MRKRGVLALFLLGILLIAGCSSYFGDKVKGVEIGMVDDKWEGVA